MSKIRISLCVFLITICSVSFALNKNNFASPDKPIIVSKAKPIFSIKLKSNPTTGFSWFLVKYNSNLIKPISHKYYAPDTKLIGAPGYEVWTFKVKPVGFIVPQVIHIQLVYTRPWNLENYNPVTFKIVTDHS